MKKRSAFVRFLAFRKQRRSFLRLLLDGLSVSKSNAWSSILNASKRGAATIRKRANTAVNPLRDIMDSRKVRQTSLPAYQLCVESLEDRRVMAASVWESAIGAFGGSDGLGKDGPMADVGLQLTQLYYAQQQGQLNNLEGLGLGILESVVANDRVLVDLSTNQNVADFQTALTNLGMQVTGTYKNLVSGWLPISSLDELAATPGLGAVTPAASSRAVGAITSQGDEAMTTDGVKQFLGFNGAGQKVGILSDSYNDLGGANSDVAGGDLPGVGNPNGFVTPVQVLDDTASGGNSDEGRAMLQIVHDVAPGAALAFHTAFTGQAAFAQGILDLQAAGSTVIADDVFYFAEPFFSDGIIAQAADTVASTGTPYFALANNHGRNSYESAYRPSTTYLPNTFASVPGAPIFDGGVAQDFDPGAGVDDFQSFTLNNNQRILLSFQWDNPFLSHTGGAASATTDMDIYVLNSANQIVGGSASSNGGGDPLELFSFTNTTGSTQTYNLMMVRFAGTVPSFVKYINMTNGGAGMGALQFATNSGTAFGHANADLGMSIGAAFYGNTPEFGVNPAQAEPFSSAGGIPIRFDDVGNPIVPVIRQNPDVVGPDGANTTFFGGDIAADADSFPNFFGTSAATPHVAALAALIRQSNPGISVSALNNTLRSTAQDMDDASTGGFDVGYDTGTGFGFVNGPAAIAAGPAGPFPVTFTGTGGNDILRVVRNGANTEFYRGGVLQFSFPASEIANITINGGNGSDTLTLDYTFGNPTAGTINFAGGESAGDDDRLVVTGYNVPNLNVNHTGPEAGTINSGSFTINFSEIEPLALSGTAADLVINFPAGPNNAVLGDDTNANFPALGLGLANTSAIDAPTFEYTSFTNPTNSLTVNFGANGDTLTMRAMDATFSPAGASPVTINGGAGIDTVNVVATNAGVTTNINGGGSLDVVNIGNAGAVGSPGLLTPVAGPVFVNGQAGGADLTVDGSGAGVNADYNVTFNTVTRSVPAGFGGVTYTGLTSLLLTVGNGINNVTVPSTSVPTTINTNGNADVVTIGNGSLDAVIGAVTVIGGAGAPDSLILNDSADASINTYLLTSTQINRAGAGLISYDGTTEDVTVNTGTNIDTVSVLSTAVNTVYNINTGNGDDRVEIGAVLNSVNNIDGQLNVTTGIGTDTLIVNDDTDAAGDTYTLTQVGNVSELSFGDGAAAVDIRYDATGTAGQVEFFELRTGTGVDTLTINNTTATNTSTITSNAGDDTWAIAGDGLQGNNNFDSANGVDTFNLNVNVAITATSLSIDGQGANGDSAQRDQLTINDGSFGRNIGFNYLVGGTAGLNVTGMGTTVNTNNLENVVYSGNGAAVTVTGTTDTDDITVAPRNGSAQIFLGGNPWDGPTDGLFANALPGVAGPGTNKGPDIFVTGLPLFSNINVSGGGGVNDQLYLYGESENAIIDPANGGQPVFRGLGLPNGVIIPGQGAGNASDNVNVSDGTTTFNFTNSVRILNPADFSQANPIIPGLIVNSGDEAGPAGDFISATPSANFKIQINGGEPPIANAPIGDTLRLTTPGTAQVYSDKVGNVSVNAAGLLGVSFTSIERTEVVPGNGRVQLIGDNNDPAVEQTDHFIVVGQDIGGDGGDADGANEFTLRINADTVGPNAPALYFNNVTNLDVFGADLTGVDGGQVDTLEITPWADNTPRGWGIATFFDEDAPAGADGDAADLLIVHTSAFGGSVSEDIVVQPSGPDNGEVNITNAGFGTPIANISYINNTDIIVLDDDGFLSDTDTLTLKGTNPSTPQVSGNDTFIVDLTAAGDAANPLVNVRDTNTGVSLYRIQNFTGFNTLKIDMLGGRDTANVTGRNNGSIALEIDGGSDGVIDTVNFTGTANANDVIQMAVGPTNDTATTFTQKSGAFAFTRTNMSRVDTVGFQGGAGTGIDTVSIFGSDASNHVSVQATSALGGSISIDSFPVLDYSGLGSGTGGTFSRIDLRSDNFNNGNPDSLKVTGTIGTDTYTYTPTSATSGNLLLATGGNSVNFTATNFGSVALDAANSTDALNVAVANAIITPGATSGSGTVTATSAAGQGLLPLTYSNVESAVVTGGTVVVTGTEGNDVITVDAAGLVTVANSGGIVQQQYNLAGANSLVINSLGGDDLITIAPSTLFPRGITIIGGVNGNGSDSLSVSGADLVVDLETSTVTGVIGGPISFTGIEHLNATATATITVNGDSGADLLTITPTGSDTTTIVPSVGGLLSINTDNPDALTINTVGGSDTVTVNGTSANETIGVARTATARVTVGTLKAIQISNSESLRIAGGDGNDTINVTGTGSTAFLIVDGGLNTTNDTLTVTNATAGATTYTPGSSSDSGTITTPEGGIEVLGTELITLTGAAAGDTLTANGTHGNDTIALQFLGGANRIWLNGQSVISLSSFGTVNLNGRFGDDKFNVLPVGLVGVTTINVNGGDPTDNDFVVVSGSVAVENVTVTPTGLASATVTGLGATININTTERMVYDGNDLAALDIVTINGTLTNDTFTYDASSLKGSFRSFASPELDVVHSARIVVDGGGGGIDTVNLLGSAAADAVTSAANAITVNTTGTAAIVTLGAGVDAVTVSALDGNDNVNLSGISVPSTVFGGDGNDTIVGSPQVDSIYGGAGNDFLVGGAGNDFEYGEEGNDTFGNLTLTADGNADDAGADQAFGGEGFDNFVWEPGDGADVNNGGGDAADIFRFFGNAAGNVFTLRQGGTPTHFNALIGALAIDNHGIEDVVVDGQGGADTFVVEDLFATEVVSINLNLGAADAAAIDPVTISGRNIADILSVTSSGAGSLSVQGLRYNVNLTNAEATDSLTINGNDGDDQVTVAAGAEAVLTMTLNGNNGEDRLTGNLAFMNGGGGNDTLIGGAGNQTMDGGAGDDIFVGNGGTDNIGGGAGSSIGDTILVAGTSGNDTIALSLNAAGQLVVTVNGLTTTYANFVGGPIASSGIEQILVEGLAGNDTLSVDSTNGAIPIVINFDGGNNADTLTLTGGVATSDTYEVGPSTDQGTSTIVIGGVTQIVRFNALEPVFDLVAGPLTVVATDADNAINYSQGGVAANGLVSIDGFETIEFSNKTTLTIDALAGSDTINLNNPTTPTGLTAINVNGDDPTGSDKLVVNGTAANDAFNYSTSNTVGSGSVAIAGAPVVNFTTTESLAIDGQGGTDALTVTSPSGHRVTFTPGSAADSGTIGSQGFGAGTASVPLSYAHIGALGTVTIAGSGDIVEFNGTANSDSFNVTGTTAQILNATSGFVTNLFTLSNVFQLELRGLDGDDTFNLTGTLAPIAGGVVVDGGNPSASDSLNLSGATGAVNVSLADPSLPSLTTITGYGADVRIEGVETANLNASGNAVTLTGTSQPDSFAYTPTGATAGKITSAGLNTVFNASNVSGSLTISGAGGVDSVTVNGTNSVDSIAIVKGATTTVGVNALQVLSIDSANTENVVINTGDGNDVINLSGTTASNQVINIIGGSPTSNAGAAADVLNITMSTAGTTAAVPGATPDAGVITSPDGTTEYSGIEFFNLTGAAGANTLNSQGTHNNDTMALQFLGGANRIWINDRAVYTFTNYQTVNINGLFGDDKINVLPIGLVGVTTINVAGGDPTASDELVVSGSAVNDAINYTTSNTVGSGSVAITGAPVVNFTTTESLAIDGQGGTDALTVTSPSGHRTTITPGSAADSGTIGSQGFGAGTASVPLSYAHIGALGTVTIAGSGDIVEFNGTANSDSFNVTGTTAQILNSTSGFVTNLFTLSNVFQLELRGLDGDDTFNLTGTLAPIAGGVVVDGGNPSASDVMNLNAPTGAVVVNLSSNTVTGYGALVETIGVETLNANVNNNNLTVNGSAGDDSLEVTPTSANSATFRLTKTSPASGSTPVVNGSQIGTLSVELLSGNDVLSVNGTTAGEAINVTGVLVTVGVLETVNFAGVEALSVFAQQGADTITVTPGAAPVFIDGGDPIGILQGDKLIVNNAVAFFAGPENDEGGVKTNGGDVSFDHVESLTVAAIPGCPFLILGTNGDDDITVIARDASTIAGADGVQDFTFSVNSGMDVVVLNQADLYIDAMAGDDDIVIRTAAPNEAAWDVNVRVAGGSPSIGAPLEADRLVLETPNNAGGSDSVVFNPTGPDTGNLVLDKNANSVYDAAGTDSLISFGSFVFDCPPANFTYTSTAGGVELIQFNGEGAPAIDDNLIINGTALDDSTVVNQVGSGSGTFTSGASPLFQFQSFDNLTVNPGAGGFDLVEINGSVGPDTVTSTANTVTLGSAVTLGQGIDQLNINTFDGNDNVDLDLALTGLKKVINLGAGNDIANLQGVAVDPADPVIYGGEGDDNIVGSPNSDLIFGGAGDDVIIGGAGNDFQYGEDGNDIFGNPNLANNGVADDPGVDSNFGGSGFDNFVWEPGDGADINNGGEDAADIFRFFGDANANTFTLRTGGTPTHFNALFGAVNIDNHGIEDVVVSSLGGADTITVGDLFPTEVVALNLNLGAADGSVDSVILNGRALADNLLVSNPAVGSTLVAGLRYNVTVSNAETADSLTINGNDGDDRIAVASGANATLALTLNGNDGNDNLDASTTTTAGAIVFNGGAGRDTIVGGFGDDQIAGGAEDDTMIGGAGADTFDGGSGFDTILVRGTPGNDIIDISQTEDVTLVETVNGVIENDALVLVAGTRTVERVSVVGDAGNDTIRVQWADSLGTDANINSLRVDVDGGAGSTGDRLGVVDLGTGDLVLYERGTTDDSGAMAIGPGNAEPLIVNFSDIETAQPIVGGGGDVVVFKHDPFEFNNARTLATYLGANSAINVDPTINPGLDPAFGFPADEDWYRVVAEKTGVLDFQVYFRQVATVGSGRPGLPNAGNLDIAVTDAAGNVINGFGNNDNSNDERVRIPAVAGQTYYLRVFANGNAVNTYNITVANYAPPTPRDLELLDNPVGDLANSDTGRSQFDNITRDNTPTLVFRLDDGIFLNDLPGNSGAGAPPDEVIPIGFQAAAGTAGYRIAIFDEGASPGPGNQTGTAPQVPIGFATFVSPGVYQFTTPVLSEGSHFLTARVQMVDPASPQQTGFGERSVALEVIIDTVLPPAFFGNSTSTTDGLKSDSDSGIASVIASFADRITNDVTPSMYGSAEANSIIRLFVDRTNNGFTADDILLGQTVTRPLSGTDQSLGEWDITSTTSLNSPDLVASIGKDGVRRLFITAEDVAGNVSAPAALDLMLDTTPAIVSAVTLPNGDSIFGIKPTPKPTPAVNFMTVTFTGGPASAGGFNLLAIDPSLATNPRNYQLVGDHNGNILIASANVVSQSDTSVVVRLNFSKPLPDDRFTLTLDDAIADAANNALDGESQAQSPGLAGSVLPSGNGISGGDFKARFTVDSRPEVGVVSEGIVYVDINGNNLWDPQGIDGDSTNRDLVFQFGQLVDAHFAGNFAPVGAAVASGYDKLGAYGKFAGNYSFVLDTNDDGVADFSSLMPGAYQVNGLPVAGNFNAAHPGDEIGLFDGSFWYLDTNGNNQIDLGERFASNFNGLPIVGDFDGNGTDDLAAFNNSTNTFTFDTNRDGNADFTWRVADDVQRFVGLSGFTDRPVAGDLNLDGIDDIGLWVKDRQGTLPRNSGEYFFWVSDRANPNPALVYDSYSPDPLGNDLFTEFGDELGLPIFGNFDPPVVSGDSGNPLHNIPAPLDVDGDGFISPLDVLIVVNVLNEYPAFPSNDPVRTYYTIGQKMADPNNDRSINPLDVLSIINYLNSKSGSGSGEGEASTRIVEAEDTSSVDAVFSQLGLDVEAEVVAKKRRK